MKEKLKRRFNWKARQVVEVKTDDSFKIETEFPVQEQGYDESNVFALPSNSRTSVVKRPRIEKKKLLTKRQRKNLEDVLMRKKKKENRAALLESLSKVQAPPELGEKLISIAEVQTKGLKRFYETIAIKHAACEVKLPRKKRRRIERIKRNMKKAKPPFSSEMSSVVSENDSDSNEVKSVKGEENTNGDNNNNNDDGDDDCVIVSTEVSSNTLCVDNVVKADDVDEVAAVKSEPNESSDDFKTRTWSQKNPEEIILDDDDEDLEVVNDVIITDNDNNGLEAASQDADTEVSNNADVVSPSVVSVKRAAVYVPVERKPEIQCGRLKLPIIGEEQVIVEAVKENEVVIITGETGSGKTTQVPQFLYEAGYTLNGKMIGVTEPRRVAAISMSQRVAEELSLTSEEVSYLIRFEGNAGPNTKIKFMTDGVLLKEIQKDFLLTRYSVIILDEVHERSIYTDILIGLLSRIVPLRWKKQIPLRLVIMSATLHVEEFRDNATLFKVTPPVISIESRQYPVTVHFNKRTPENYVAAAFKKVCKIHTSLPDGGILVFVTGQQEVNTLVRKLRAVFTLGNADVCGKIGKSRMALSANKDYAKGDMSYKSILNKLRSNNPDSCIDRKDVAKIHPCDDTDGDLLDEVDDDDECQSVSDDDTDDDDDELMNIAEMCMEKRCQPMWVLPLYSLLSSQEQRKVFKAPPPNYRLCVVATNIAETSLTIPNVKYVVDTGRTKTKLYDKYTGISTYEVVWTSKASANQRAGRAGRTMPGHCYRLYSSAVFNDQFEKWSVPEIQRKPVDELVLQMKCLGLDHIKNFPFPNSPGPEQLEAAECRLIMLGALKLDESGKDNKLTKLTDLGASIVEFPVAPRFAKMLCYSHQDDLLPFAILIVAALAVPQVIDIEKKKKQWKKWIGVGNKLLLGDVCVLYNAVSFIEKGIYEGRENAEEFCENVGIRYKAVREVSKLRLQLTKIVNMNVDILQVPLNPYMPILTETQAYQLRQIVLMGMVDKVGRKLDAEELKRAKLPAGKAAYKLSDIEQIAFLHSNSVLYDTKPNWIVFQEAFEQNGRLYLKGVTAIESDWLPVFASHLCHIPSTFDERNTYYNQKEGNVVRVVDCTFGRSGWLIPAASLPCAFCEDTCKFFAKFFLEGKVCHKLQKYAAYCISSPDTVLKSWSIFLLPRAEHLVKSLINQRVFNSRTLFDSWRSDPEFLLDAYLEWLPKSTHKNVKKIWPPYNE